MLIAKTLTMDDIIHGDKLAELADVSFNWPKPGRNEEKLDEQNQVIFCKTDFLDDVFGILRNSKHKHLLFTHNSDIVISEQIYDKKPDCIDMWYAENVYIKQDDLIPIPLGVERPQGHGYSADMNVLMEVYNKDVEIKNFAFFCHNVGNNPNCRTPAMQWAKKQGFVTFREYGIPFKEFLTEIKRHVYTICVRGNGLDTHRLWETVYLGGIPIVDRLVCTEYFAKFIPMVLVDDWQTITFDKLLRDITENLRSEPTRGQQVTSPYPIDSLKYYKNIINQWKENNA